MTPKKTDAELLAEAQDLDDAYAQAVKFDASQQNTAVTGYTVIWDNGIDCGELWGGPFQTEIDAIEFGENWACEMQSFDPDADDDTYTFDVIEVMGEPNPSDEDLAGEEEAEYYAELSAGYERDQS